MIFFFFILINNKDAFLFYFVSLISKEARCLTNRCKVARKSSIMMQDNTVRVGFDVCSRPGGILEGEHLPRPSHSNDVDDSNPTSKCTFFKVLEAGILLPYHQRGTSTIVISSSPGSKSGRSMRYRSIRAMNANSVQYFP